MLDPALATVNVQISAQYVDLSEILCPLPDVTNFTTTSSQTEYPAMFYSISVSTDGVTFGPSVPLVVYNNDDLLDICIECDTTETPNPQSCSILVRSHIFLVPYTNSIYLIGIANWDC